MADFRPMTRIDPRVLCTGPRFVPVCSAATDITRTFDRVRAELAAGVPQPVRVNAATGEPFHNDQE